MGAPSRWHRDQCAAPVTVDVADRERTVGEPHAVATARLVVAPRLGNAPGSRSSRCRPFSRSCSRRWCAEALLLGALQVTFATDRAQSEEEPISELQWNPRFPEQLQRTGMRMRLPTSVACSRGLSSLPSCPQRSHRDFRWEPGRRYLLAEGRPITGRPATCAPGVAPSPISNPAATPDCVSAHRRCLPVSTGAVDRGLARCEQPGWRCAGRISAPSTCDGTRSGPSVSRGELPEPHGWRL